MKEERDGRTISDSFFLLITASFKGKARAIDP